MGANLACVRPRAVCAKPWLWYAPRMRHVRLFSLLLVAASGVFYVGHTLSPSSYALALDRIQVPDAERGLVIGVPRPIRSDEWFVLTPMIQSTVNNHLQRYNATSFYQEDLRSMYSMPIADWGLIFKPAFWLFPWVNAAYAYSFYWYTLMVLFIAGYALLARRTGLPPGESLLVASLLFLSPFTQRWWTVTGSVEAFFPWVILAATAPSLPRGGRACLFYYAAVAWMLSFFYPPLIVSMAFLALFLVVGLRLLDFRWQELAALATAGVLAVGTVVFYLRDYLILASSTFYPGQRRSSGGGAPFDFFVSQFLPNAQSQSHESLIGSNICEISMVGSFYLLAVAIFVDYGKLLPLRRILLSLGLPLLCM